MSFLHIIFYSVSRDVFGVFGCTLYDEGDQNWYLNVMPWIQCSSPSPTYKNMLAASIVVTFAFLVTFIAAVWIIVTKVKAETNDEDMDERFGFLYLAYHADRRQWEIIQLIRRLLFSFVTAVVPYSSKATLFLSLVIVIQLSIYLHHKYRPYREPLENHMESASLYTIFVSFFLSLLSSLMTEQTWMESFLIALNAIILIVFIVLAVVVPVLRSSGKMSYNRNIVSTAVVEMEPVSAFSG